MGQGKGKYVRRWSPSDNVQKVHKDRMSELREIAKAEQKKERDAAYRKKKRQPERVQVPHPALDNWFKAKWSGV